MRVHMNKHAHQSGPELAMFWALLACGALPFVGFLVHGTWDQVELGIGTTLSLFSAHGLVREYRRKRS
jgi:hypothetical protein